MALPTGKFNEGWGVGVGGSFKRAFPVTTAGTVTIAGGYIYFAGKMVTLPLAMQAFMGQTQNSLLLLQFR